MKNIKKILCGVILALGLTAVVGTNALIMGGLVCQGIADPGPSNVVVTEEM